MNPRERFFASCCRSSSAIDRTDQINPDLLRRSRINFAKSLTELHDKADALGMFPHIGSKVTYQLPDGTIKSAKWPRQIVKSLTPEQRSDLQSRVDDIIAPFESDFPSRRGDSQSSSDTSVSPDHLNNEVVHE
jgi:hypothetical protein